MNCKIIKLIAATAIVSTSAMNAEIVLSPELSMSGYLDVAIVGNDFDDVENNSAQYSAFELDFNFTTEPVSAVFEIEYYDDSEANSSYDLEDVYFTFSFNESLSLSAGRITSYLGFEDGDAPEMYQFSEAYVLTEGIPGYAEGISVDYAASWGSLGVWLGENDDTVSYELAGSLTPTEQITLFVAYANDPNYVSFNTWASFEADALTLAVEYVSTSDEFGYDIDSYLLMANYAMGDALIGAIEGIYTF